MTDLPFSLELLSIECRGEEIWNAPNYAWNEYGIWEIRNKCWAGGTQSVLFPDGIRASIRKYSFPCKLSRDIALRALDFVTSHFGSESESGVFILAGGLWMNCYDYFPDLPDRDPTEQELAEIAKKEKDDRYSKATADSEEDEPAVSDGDEGTTTDEEGGDATAGTPTSSES